MRISRLISAMLVFALALSTAACISTAPTQPTESETLTPLSIRLDWTTNALHAPLYVALEKGYYKEVGLDVTINQATDKDDVLKLVDTGVDTLGLYYHSSVIRSQSRGYDVRAVGAYVQHPLNVILVDQRTGIASLTGLEGKTVGFTSDPLPKGNLSTTAASLKNMVEKAGGDFSKIELINVGDAGVQMLATQRIDALGGVYEYHEKYLLDKEGISTDVYRLHEHGAPDFYELVVVASEKVATGQAEAIRKFMEATGKGATYTQQNPQDAADILLKAAPILKKELVTQSLIVVTPFYQESGKPFGHHTRERWVAAAEWLLAQKVIAELPDFDKLIVTQ